MNKIVFILFAGLSGLMNMVTAEASKMPPINAAAYIVADEHSKVILAQQEANAQIEPAALTQLMTAYLVFQAIAEGKLTLKQPLMLSDQGWHISGSRLFMQPEQSLAVATAIQGMLTLAANDAALTLAEAVAGSEAAFVQQMNQQAQQLGLKHSHFVNCTGLPVTGQYSSAHDLLVLAQALWRDFPQYRSWFGQTKFSYGGLTQLNHNLLLFREKSVKGMATGASITGGYNIIANTQQDNRYITTVLLGADSSAARAIEAGKLLRWAQHEFNTIHLVAADQPITHLRVYHGQQSMVAVGIRQDVYVTLPSTVRTALTPKLEAVQPVLAPINKGQVMGTIRWMQGQTVVAQKEVVALEDVTEASGLRRWYEKWLRWWLLLWHK